MIVLCHFSKGHIIYIKCCKNNIGRTLTYNYLGIPKVSLINTYFDDSYNQYSIYEQGEPANGKLLRLSLGSEVASVNQK